MTKTQDVPWRNPYRQSEGYEVIGVLRILLIGIDLKTSETQEIKSVGR